MDNLIMEEAIKLGKEALKKGASLSDVQSYLRQKKSGLNLDSKQENKYEKQIANLDKSSVRVTSLNARKLAFVAGFSLAMTGIGGAVIGNAVKYISGCGAGIDSEVGTDIDDDTKEGENTVSGSAITSNNEEVTETNDNVATKANDNIDYVLPDYLTFNANDMEVAKANIADFINDGLTKGLGTFGIKDEKGNTKLFSGFTEDNKTKKVEAYLMLYLGANINQIDYKVLAELNQEGNLTANQIYETAINTMYEMFDDSYTLMSEDDKLAIEKIFSDKNDVKYINSIIDLIIKYNNAKNDSERKAIVKEGIAAKEDLLKYAASRKLEVNPLAMDYAFLELEALDNLANGQIITDNEDDIKLYNNIVSECLTEEQIERYGIREQIKQFSGLGVEESSQNLVSVMRNMFHGLVVDKMDAALAYADNVDKNAETSFNYIVKEIADKIDLSLFIANPYSSSDWIWKINNNGMSLEEAEKATKPSTKTVIIDNVKPESVPEKDREKNQVTYTDSDTGEKTNATYVKAKKDAIEQASSDLAAEWTSVGDINKISEMSEPSKPSENSNDYNAVYNYWYAKTWNDQLSEYKANAKETEEKNNKKKPTTEAVAEGDKTAVDKSDNYDDPTPPDEVTFVPDGDYIVIEEGTLQPDEYSSDNGSNNNVSIEQGTNIDEGILEPDESSEAEKKAQEEAEKKAQEEAEKKAQEEAEKKAQGEYQEQGTNVDEGIMLDAYRSDAINSLKALRDELTATINNADILGTNTKVR